MALQTMHDLLIDELRDIYHAEKQILREVPKVAKAATTPELRQALEHHLTETEEHVTRLERAFAHLGVAARGKTCHGMQGLLAEGKEVLEEDGEDIVLDAAMIAAAQRVEHYEIAAYGCAAAYADLLGETEVRALLNQTLEEERAADQTLSDVATSTVNPKAMRTAAGAGRDG